MRDCVVVVGSGLMGSGIAAVSALAGNATLLVDAEPARAVLGMENAKKHLEELEKNGLADARAAGRARGLLQVEDDLGRALARARLVIEAIVENLEAKRALFRQMDALLPEQVPILSNTSGLRITDIAAGMANPQRAVTAHFWFPAHLVPLVEVVVGDRSDPGLARRVKEELCGWGKAAVLVRRDLPGQLANRILQAMLREAVHIVSTGLASPEDVDTAVKMGMGVRLPAWGLLEHADGVGVDLVYSTQTNVLPEISASQRPDPLLGELVARGDLGYKTGKGFYDWSEKSMDRLQRRRNHFIMQALKILKEEG